MICTLSNCQIVKILLLIIRNDDIKFKILNEDQIYINLLNKHKSDGLTPPTHYKIDISHSTVVTFLNRAELGSEEYIDSHTHLLCIGLRLLGWVHILNNIIKPKKNR